MKKSVNIGYFENKLGMTLAEVLPIVKDAGFTALDINPPFRETDCLALSAERKKLCEKYGFEIVQTHGPFNRYGTYGDEMPTILERAYEGTKLMGAKYWVVHGDEFDINKCEYTPEAALAYNYEMYAPYVERAEKDGISIAFETVFTDSRPYPRFCSQYDELAAMIAKFGSDRVCCCWDFGHANVAFGSEQYENMRKMGSLLKCTHIHDNNGKSDQHLMPFYGTIDWKAYINVMRDIGYDGTLSLEFSGAGQFTPEFVPTFAKYAYDTLVCFENL